MQLVQEHVVDSEWNFRIKVGYMGGGFVNLTPHSIHIEGYGDVMPDPRGPVRLDEIRLLDQYETIGGVKCVRPPEYIGLTPKLEFHNENLIFSAVVCEYAMVNRCYRDCAIFSPDTGPDGVIRNENGQIIGTKQLIFYQPEDFGVC